MRLQDEVLPIWPVRLPAPRWDRLARRRDGILERLIHIDGQPVVLRAWSAGRAVRMAADAPTHELAERGLARLRFWTAVDDDLRPFADRFGRDPLIGRSIREAPEWRPHRTPMPFEALVWAICEQLITGERATAIQRRLTARLGRRDAVTGLADAPSAHALARAVPAALRACDLSAARALTMIRAAREVASGRVDLLDRARRADGHARLRTLPGIGSWTVACLALHGEGDADALPSGDLAYRLLVGHIRAGRPAPPVDEATVEAFFARYAGWRALAGAHMLRIGAEGVLRGRTAA